MKSLVPLGVLLLPSLAAAQTTIRVPADVPTIQGAIEQAQDGDTVLVASGTYNELVDYLGKAITVASESGAGATTIDATGLFDTVVRFGNKEGSGSVLRGFTITGGNSSTLGGGVSAYEASPRIEACAIRGNLNHSGAVGGLFGDATLVDCSIEGNVAGLGVGGVWGEAVLRRCTVRNNYGYDAGGISLYGRGRAIDCVITGNISEEGTYGGGVSLGGDTPFLLRCLIADNTAASRGQYPVLSAGVFVYSSGAGPLIRSCTITRNIVISPYVPPGEDCGGVQGPAQLVNTIVYGNDGLQIGYRAAVQAAYCNIEGGHPGPGNFALDPLFADPARGDFHLATGSPCIDAGAPLAEFEDPDGTRADVGAFYYPQGNAIVRNGTGVNPPFLTSVTRPRIGNDWHARVDSALVPGATLSVITVRTQALEPGILLPQGELLVDGYELFRALIPSSGSLDDLFIPIPSQTTLIGREVHAQGILLVARRAHLGNALRLILGN